MVVFYRGLHCPACRAQLSELNYEPGHFSEPGLVLVRPEGTVYYETINTMPWGRPHLDEILGGIDYA